MNRRPITILVCLLAFPGLSLANDSELKKRIKEQVETLNEATINGDYAKVADLTHPKVLEMAGGRAKIIALMETTFKKFKKEGVEFQSGKVGEPSDIVKQGDDLYVVVPFEMKIKLPDAKLTSYGYVIGVSTDQGKAWTFINSTSNQNLKKVLPNLPPALKLPEEKKPLVEKN